MRLGALLPRAVLIALAWILATAAFTLAADKTNIIGQQPTATATGPAAPPNLTVPDVTGQAFVFAKGLLEDAGFAWNVSGSVHGYAGNQVVGQSPAAGTQVVDTGAPTVVVTLVKGRYGEQGVPQDTSSYRGTAIELANKPAAPATHPAAKAKPSAPKAKPSAAKAKPAVRKPAGKPVAPVKRPPAFHVPGARKEPLDEISLPSRAERLAAWIATKPARNTANVNRWLYQHAWIVTGARFGWWHGAQALETLIAVDQRVERLWGIGSRSESVARTALARVRREAR
jgi:PASTA domain